MKKIDIKKGVFLWLCMDVKLCLTRQGENKRLPVFENRVLRRIFGSKRNEVTGGWTKLHNKELENLYSAPNTVRMIKSRRIKWAGHVARM
jgi:hypothetical protein